MTFSMGSSSFSGFFVPLSALGASGPSGAHSSCAEGLGKGASIYHVLLCWSLTCLGPLGPHQSPCLPLMLFADGNLQDHVLFLRGAGFPAWLWLHFLPLFGCDALRNPLLGEPDLWPGHGSDMNFCPATMSIKSGLCPWLPTSSSEHSYLG